MLTTVYRFVYQTRLCMLVCDMDVYNLNYSIALRTLLLYQLIKYFIFTRNTSAWFYLIGFYLFITCYSIKYFVTVIVRHMQYKKNVIFFIRLFKHIANTFFPNSIVFEWSGAKFDWRISLDLIQIKCTHNINSLL